MRFLVIVLMIALGAAMSAEAACPPAGYDLARLEALKAQGWKVTSDRARAKLARALTDCLAASDPALRDGLAFEALQHWMREGVLDERTVLAIGEDVQARLTAPEGDGFERPFAALVLAEVARRDRVAPFLTPTRRTALLTAAVDYFTGVHDYRGFDDTEGWRHGVAHGADLLLQLALNSGLGKPELQRLRDAVATQIAPSDHFYIYGESERFAAPILFIAQRRVFSEAEWTAWLDDVSAPAPLSSWRDAFAHNADLARLHNVRAFVEALYLNASLDQSPDDNALLPGAEAALRRLP